MTFSIHDINLIIDKQHILNSINMTFKTGEVHAVIGGNGAGKSSLMKVLYGAYKANSGTFKFNDHITKNFKDYIAFVNQEVDDALYPELSVYDNIYTHEIKQNFFYKQRNIGQLNALLKSWNLKLDPNALIKDLPISKKQMLIIIRALIQKKQLIILDEPTASLSETEVRQLFKEISNIKHDVSIIFISHRIDELMEISDHISVLKNGQLTYSKPTHLWSKDAIVQAITNSVSETINKAPHVRDELRFELNNVHHEILQDISLKACYGEIVGIAGLVGAGKTELANYLFRTLNDVAYVPEERQKNALILDASIRDNICLNNEFIVNASLEKQSLKMLAPHVNLKYASSEQSVSTLSGGNQQKVVFLRGLYQEAEIYILDEPTVGIDIGAKHDLFKQIIHLAEKGKTIIYLSSDFHEIIQISDTIHVLRKGRIINSNKNTNITEQVLLKLASGGTT